MADIKKLNIKALNMALEIMRESDVKASNEILVAIYHQLMQTIRQEMHDANVSNKTQTVVDNTLKKFGLDKFLGK